MARKWVDKTEADIEAWWSPDDGRRIVGEVLQARLIKDDEGKQRLIWVVKCEESTMGRKKGEDKGTEYPAGTIIGVTHRTKLQPVFEEYLMTANFDVAIDPVEKIKLAGKKTMWRMKVATAGGTIRKTALGAEAFKPKQLAPAKSVPDAEYVPADNDDDGSDDIPF